jgi:hypothetical protein
MKIVLRSTSNFQCWKLEHESKIICFGLFWSSQAWNMKAASKARANYLAFAKLLCNLNNYKTSKLYKNSTYFNLLCCLCVPRLLQEQEHKEYICKNVKQDIRVSNTPFSKNQAWKCDFKHNFVFSSHKKHLFSHTCCKVEWTQFKPTHFVLRILVGIEEQYALLMCF